MVAALFDIESLFDSINGQSLLLTPNRRLAAHVQAAYAESCYRRGLSVWETPNIVPLDEWLQSCWQQLLTSGNDQHLTLLQPSQETLLWERIVRDDEKSALLKPYATAKQAQSAYRVLSLWQTALNQEFYYHPDCARFAHWAKQFQTLCAQGQLLSNTALPQFLITAFNEKKLFSPAHIILLGFQHMPPLQQTLLEATGATIRQHSPSTVATVTQKLACDNGVQEFHAAADWAKRQLESNPHKRIGIIVPDLAQQRSSIESVLASVFEPQYLLPDTARYQLPFNISAGTPLNQTPLIDSALLLLGLLRDEFTYRDLYGLLKSPFVKKTADDFSAGNGTANFGASTQLEIFLRAGGWPVFTLKGLQKQLNNQPPLNTQYQPFIRAIEVASGLQHQHQRETTELTEWVVIFETILSAFQWPCSDRRLDSIEYQQLTRWRAALLDFNQLSALSGKVSLTAALGLLERHIGSIDFQAQSAQTPLQVLGLLEGSGLQFDALWLIGTNDSQWPAAANPSPFIPINLQREANMPHASAERELEFARELLHSYCHSSNEIIASYALHSDDRALRASTLINDFEETTLSALGLASARFPHPYYQSHALGTEHALRFEVINETTGPIVDLEKESIRGGSSILKNQAACPFKAYAIHRLAAQQLPEPSYHLGPAQRGIALHSALESLWNTLKDSSQLAACHEAALDELLQQAVIKAIKPLARQRADLFGKVFSASESRRLSGLLKQWLAIEKTRDPFVVIATEKALLINLEGLPLRVRIDRIDRLEDGSLALIDYKTGKCALNKWQGERLEEPQLPLYSVTFAGLEPESDVSTSNIQTLAFAQINVEKQGFVGISSQQGIAPGINSVSNSRGWDTCEDWSAVNSQWRKALQTLSQQFLTGVASVDPVSKTTCQYCHLQSLCRIHDQKGNASA